MLNKIVLAVKDLMFRMFIFCWIGDPIQTVKITRKLRNYKRWFVVNGTGLAILKTWSVKVTR